MKKVKTWQCSLQQLLWLVTILCVDAANADRIVEAVSCASEAVGLVWYETVVRELK